MQDNMSSQIVTLSEEQLNDLFSDTPNTTVTADMLKGGSQQSTEKFTLDDNGTPVIKTTQSAIPEFDLDAIEKEAEDRENGITTEKKEGEETPEKKEDAADKKDTKKDDPKKVEETEEVKTALKNTVNYLVETGVWKDFEGREDMEMTSESYAKLSAAQDKARLDEMFSEVLDSTGDYGKAIIEHIKAGGDPNDVIEIFKEQKELESFDKTTQQGKLDYMYTYYTEVVGWKEEKAQRYLNQLLKSEKPEDAIAEELGEVEERFDEYYKGKLADTQKETQRQAKENQEKQEKFVTNIKEALKKESITEKERQKIEKAITVFNTRLPNGAVVNDFYVKFAEKQNDPAEYVKLVQFILDREGYEKKLSQKKDSSDAQQSFNFTNKNKKQESGLTSRNPELQQEDKNTKLDFSVIFKNK